MDNVLKDLGLKQGGRRRRHGSRRGGNPFGGEKSSGGNGVTAHTPPTGVASAAGL